MQPKYHHQLVGGNFRMDAMQAAVLRVKPPHLDAWTEARRLNASRYVRLFRDAGLEDRITLPIEPRDRRHIFNQFVIRARIATGSSVTSTSAASATRSTIRFRSTCSRASPLGYRAGDFPEAERAAETLAIPIFGELTLDQQRPWSRRSLSSCGRKIARPRRRACEPDMVNA